MFAEWQRLRVVKGPILLLCSTTEKQGEYFAFKDVVFQEGKFKTCAINVTVSKKE